VVLFWVCNLGGLFYIEFSFIHCCGFAAIIAATDPVAILSIFKKMDADPTLYSLIYGESILNDAVSLILYSMVADIHLQNFSGGGWQGVWDFTYLLVGSSLVGLLISMATALVFKNQVGEPSSRTESTICILVPWVAYLICESIDLSGIVGILFCGIGMSRYALNNLSEGGRHNTHSFYETLGSMFEDTVFLFMGMAFFTYDLPFRYSCKAWLWLYVMC